MTWVHWMNEKKMFNSIVESVFVLLMFVILQLFWYSIHSHTHWVITFFSTQFLTRIRIYIRLLYVYIKWVQQLFGDWTEWRKIAANVECVFVSIDGIYAGFQQVNRNIFRRFCVYIFISPFYSNLLCGVYHKMRCKVLCVCVCVATAMHFLYLPSLLNYHEEIGYGNGNVTFSDFELINWNGCRRTKLMICRNAHWIVHWTGPKRLLKSVSRMFGLVYVLLRIGSILLCRTLTRSSSFSVYTVIDAHQTANYFRRAHTRNFCKNIDEKENK